MFWFKIAASVGPADFFALTSSEKQVPEGKKTGVSGSVKCA